MNQENTEISIDGKRIKTFNQIYLFQPIFDHHHFQISVDMSAIEKDGEYTIEKSREWLGKPLVIYFQKSDFVGIITNIQLNQENGFNGIINISGFSKTILMDSGAHLQSWSEKSIKKIAKEITKNSRVEARINPKNTEIIPYLCQYQESYFDFLKRQAIDYREWFFSDGVNLHFGLPKESPNAIELEYNKDILSLNIDIQVKPHAQELYSFQKMQNKFIIEKSKNRPDGLSELGMHSFKTSNEVYPFIPKTVSDIRIRNKGAFDDALKNNQNAAIASYHIISGTTSLRGLTPGSIIKIAAGMKENLEETINQYGEFMVIEAKHQEHYPNGYTCEFKAIPSGIKSPPIPSITRPVAQTQMATVTSNEDPSKKGRVQVQFPWQDPQEKTDWISVLTPDGGSSDLVNTNRGFVFIPEKGDQVMIGFRYNDPNRPFVMGSIFNGSNASGGSDANKSKSITTRSGATISFDDDEGKGKISISDPSGNTVTLNGDETITISAPKGITMNSKEITLNAEEKITIKGDKKVDINSKEITQTAKQKIDLKSDANMLMASKAKEETHKTYKLTAQATVDIEGATAVNAKGGIINLN
ncbi:MAG: phage baseplate assembly protein V [Flavobacteriales bacterium]|jgi:hypothetical protein|nr:phage baseplate assembly protein V [Flavobacteriales bacterium]